MPKDIDRDDWRTAIYLDVETESIKDEPNRRRYLPAFYSKHTGKRLGSGKTMAMGTGKLRRPKLPIEYMYKHNIASLQRYSWQNGGHHSRGFPYYEVYERKYHNGIAERLATTFSYESNTEIPYSMFLKIMRCDYWLDRKAHIPSDREFMGVLPADGTGKPLIEFGRSPSQRESDEVRWEVNGQTFRSRVEVANESKTVSYALFDVGGPYMAAIRYAWITNPDPKVQARRAKNVVRRNSYFNGGGFSFDYRSTAPGADDYLQITVRYLGEGFSRRNGQNQNFASLHDIITPAYWENNNDDDIVRYLTPTYGYVGIEGYETIANRPRSIIMWVTSESGHGNPSLVLSDKSDRSVQYHYDDWGLAAVRLFHDE